MRRSGVRIPLGVPLLRLREPAAGAELGATVSEPALDVGPAKLLDRAVSQPREPTTHAHGLQAGGEREPHRRPAAEFMPGASPPQCMNATRGASGAGSSTGVVSCENSPMALVKLSPRAVIALSYSWASMYPATARVFAIDSTSGSRASRL